MVGRLFLILYGSKLRIRKQSSSLPDPAWLISDLYLDQSDSKDIFVQHIKLFCDFFPPQALMSQLSSHLKANCHTNMCFCLMLTYICNEKFPFNGMLLLILKQYFPRITLLPNFHGKVKACGGPMFILRVIDKACRVCRLRYAFNSRWFMTILEFLLPVHRFGSKLRIFLVMNTSSPTSLHFSFLT